MRVLIADDQPEVRSALRLLLEQDPDLRVVGEATESESLLAEAANSEPDVVMLDWELPIIRRDGADHRARSWLVDTLRSRHPNLAVVVLSGFPEARKAAIRAGVDRFISKGDPPERLLQTLRSVEVGNRE